jgi:hypothetical protein
MCKLNYQITTLAHQLIEIKNGKLPKSHRYNRLPLLRSHPGGFSGAGCLGLAGAKIEKLRKKMKEKREKSRIIIQNIDNQKH